MGNPASGGDKASLYTQAVVHMTACFVNQTLAHKTGALGETGAGLGPVGQAEFTSKEEQL